MSKLSKSLLVIVILLLAWLAVLPYWPAIKEEATNLYTAWQQVRSPETEKPEAEEAESAESETKRERRVATPELPANQPPEAKAAQATVAEPVDPFIVEARQRAESDPESAMQWLQEQGKGETRLRAMLEVVALWAADDAESALLWLESNAQGIARLETLNNGVELWAERDPDAAAKWINGMANDGSKIVAAKSLAASWGSADPEKASVWLETLPEGEIKNSATDSFVEAWAETDPKAASQWALERAASTGDPSLLEQSLKSYALQNPAQAETFAREIAASQDSPEGILAYVNARAEINPAETTEWLSSLEPGDPINNPEYFGQYTQAALATWTETDSIAASAWLSEQPLGPKRDAAIAGFTESIQRFEPEAAVTWANTISDPEQRSKEVTRSVRSWAERNSQEALNWVINAELDPDLQEQLAREIGVN